MSKKKTLLISIIILFSAGVVTLIIFLTEPTAKRAGATKETAMLVKVTTAEHGAFQPDIVATGTVEPAQDIILSPRVNGQIIRLSDSFTPGGFVEKGEMLLQIDPADYQNTLQLRKSDLKQAMADLNIEMGRQDVARKDYQLFDDTLSKENKALVLREPQLNAVRSRVEAAEAAVRQAKLNLQRTIIRAPFDAHILSRNANVGSQVSPGDDLGRLVGMDVYWIIATVPLSKIQWLSFPDSDDQSGSEVRIKNRTAWQEGEYRTGYLYKLIGTLEDQTRMARVLISVPDPLAYHTDTSDLPQLMLGAFVEVSIEANRITDVVRLSRDHIRKDETVWVMENDQLSIRDVQIKLNDQKYAYITNGLKEGDKIVTTNLTTVVDGAKLRLEGSEKETGQDISTQAANQN